MIAAVRIRLLGAWRETPIVPPMAAITNAVEQATGIRFDELPMSPPKVLAAIDAANNAVADAVE